jgi:DNA-binding response OmpR family regulator
MSGERVLIVDDDPEIRELVARYLKKEAMKISQAENGERALALLQRETFDLVVLDLMMAGLDGFTVLKIIREKNQDLRVMIVSAREEDYDKVLGFGLGADDYITKPFSPSELVARVKSQMRRMKISRETPSGEFESIVSGKLKLDLKSFKAWHGDDEIALSHREFRLLRLFMENPGRVFTKQQIYSAAWDDEYFDENTLMVYISHLRDKIEDDPGSPGLITTVRGIGYRFDPQQGRKT